VLLLRRGS